MAISVTGLYASHHEDHDLEFTQGEQNGNRDIPRMFKKCA